MTFATLALALLLTTGTEAGDTSDLKPILLDFTATWCGPCKAMQPAVEQLKAKGYPIKAVDIDRFPELAERYGVKSVPTFVLVDPNGRELARRSGVCPAGELATFYRQGLANPTSVAASEAAPRSKAVLRGQDPEEVAESASSSNYAASRNAYRPWETVVRIKVYNHMSRPRPSIGFGSGTIIHSTETEAYILTCAHIFKIEELGGRQPHPSRFPLKVSVDLFDGRLRPSATDKQTPYMLPSETDIAAEVLDYDYAGDVGLIKITVGRPLPYSKVVAPGWMPAAREKMTSLGCSEGRPATAWTTYVTRPQIKFQNNGGLYAGTECDHPPLQGRSGGGLFNQEGLLVGVCDFNDGPGGHGLYASPPTIHRLLTKNQLQVCWNVEAPAPAPDRALLAQNDQVRGVSNSGRGQLKARAQSHDHGDGPDLTIPRPEILNIQAPDGIDSIAIEDNAAGPEGSTQRFRWQPVPAGRLDRVLIADANDFDEPARRPARPQTARHEIDHTATDSDLFLAPPDREEWEAARASANSPATQNERRGRWSPAPPASVPTRR